MFTFTLYTSTLACAWDRSGWYCCVGIGMADQCFTVMVNHPPPPLCTRMNRIKSVQTPKFVPCSSVQFKGTFSPNQIRNSLFNLTFWPAYSPSLLFSPAPHLLSPTPLHPMTRQALSPSLDQAGARLARLRGFQGQSGLGVGQEEILPDIGSGGVDRIRACVATSCWTRNNYCKFLIEQADHKDVLKFPHYKWLISVNCI